jgi:chromosome segregation ATPase
MTKDSGSKSSSVTTDDIMLVLTDFAEQINGRFDRLEGHMDRIEGHMDNLEQASREHTSAVQELTARVDRVDQKLEGINDDITYLYKLIENLKKDIKSGKLTDEETRSRLEEVEAVAKRMSIKYGV